MATELVPHKPPLNAEFYLDPVEERAVSEITTEEAPNPTAEDLPTRTGHGSNTVLKNNTPAGGPTSFSPDEPQEPNLPRGGTLAASGGRVHGGRSTPVPSRYQYQPSSTGTSSFLTGTDREGHLPWSGGRNYVAVDPFLPSVVQSLVNFTQPNAADELPSEGIHYRPSTPMPPPPYHPITTHPIVPSTSEFVLAFLFDTLPRQVYLHLLLTLPSLYFSRVARVFEDAELSMPDIKKLAVVSAYQWKDQSTSMVQANWNFEPSIVSPHFLNLKTSWEHFIDSLMREWKTLNIVSALLLSAILTTLQINGATTDPITRDTALLALICGLMSLLYGCLYILRFNTMRKAHKAAEWAEEAQQTKTLIWWNVWVLLAMPSIWLSWSIIFYLACVMSFVWRTGTAQDPILEISPLTALAPRIVTTSVFMLGVVYFFLIVSTFRRYGDAMDRAFRRRVLEWAESAGSTYSAPFEIPYRTSTLASDASTPPSGSHPLPTPRPYSHSQPLRPAQNEPPRRPPTSVPTKFGSVIPAPPSFSRPLPNRNLITFAPFKTVKVMDLRFMSHVANDRPETLNQRDILPEDWAQFIADASSAWDGHYPRLQTGLGPAEGRHVLGRSRPQDLTARSIAWWNAHFFRPRGARAVLCEEHALDHPMSPSHAIYLLDIRGSTPDMDHDHDHDRNHDPVELEHGAGLAERFGSVPEGLERIDVYDPLPDIDHRRQPIRMGKTLIYAGPHTARVHWGMPSRPLVRSPSTDERSESGDGVGSVRDLSEDGLGVDDDARVHARAHFGLRDSLLAGSSAPRLSHEDEDSVSSMLEVLRENRQE